MYSISDYTDNLHGNLNLCESVCCLLVEFCVILPPTGNPQLIGAHKD